MWQAMGQVHRAGAAYEVTVKSALRREGSALTRWRGAGLTVAVTCLPRERGLLVGSTSGAVRPTVGQSCKVHRGVHVPVQGQCRQVVQQNGR